MKRLILKISAKLLLLLLLLRYKNIWALKKYMQTKERMHPLYIAAYDGFFAKRGSWIGYDACFKGEPCFPHGYFGVFVSGGARVGVNAVIFQGVTIGSNSLSDSQNNGAPILGDNIYIGAGAAIIGNVNIGDNCRIGANAVVYRSMPANSIAVQCATRVIQKETLDNRFFTNRVGHAVYYDNGVWK